MTQLYVANVSLQHQHLHYRVPEGHKTLVTEIPPGHQKRVHHEDSEHVIDAIVKHLSTFGVLSVKEAQKTNKPFSMVYSVDKVIDAETIVALHAKAKDIRGHEQFERLKHQSAAVADSVARQGQELGVKLTATETEIRQVGGGAEGAEKMDTTIRAEVQPSTNRNRRAR